MQLEFSTRGGHGQVAVTVGTSTDPDAVGAGPNALGIANCQATVEFSGGGYHGLFGWIQLVRSDDNSSGGNRFEIDPLDILGEVNHPFGFFGIKPTLFDAPSRDTRADLDWHAHSFLAFIDPGNRQDICALLGFSWGFTIRSGQVNLTRPTALAPDDWDGHLSELSDRFPAWTFLAGYASG